MTDLRTEIQDAMSEGPVLTEDQLENILEIIEWERADAVRDALKELPG